MVTAAENDQVTAGRLDGDLRRPEPAESLPRTFCGSARDCHVCVQIDTHVFRRHYRCEGKLQPPVTGQGEELDTQKRHHDDRPFAEIIWPAWPTNLAEEKETASSPLATLEQHWDAATSRLRDSAKWLAAVLGAAIAAVIPTAPLAGLTMHHLSAVAVVLGLLGLLSLSVTLVLILLVLRPVSLAYDQIVNAERGPLWRWKTIVDNAPDLYLPCDVEQLSQLRPLMNVEEATLKALVGATEDIRGMRRKLDDARAARAARLYELRTATASIVAVAAYYCVRARSTRATIGGALFGFLGLVLVVACIAWPIS